MKILFDHQKFSLQRYGGISRYFAGLNAGLNKLPDVSSRIAALYSTNEYVKDESFPLQNKVGEAFFRNKQKKIYKWNRRYSRWNVQWADYDVFHPTYYDPYFLKAIKKPFVVTVHDMAHELYPHLFGDAAEVIERKRKLITHADALIAISDYTRQDIIKFFPEVESKIHVVYHGYMSAEVDVATSLTLPAKYILFVGERWHYKNFKTFVNGIAPLLKADPDLYLICAGGGAFNAEEQNILKALAVTGKCKQMNVDESELKQLYAKAQVFVFPSLHEGFGFPLLEAFAAGCPVACSNATCMPEVAGDAAVYFDPTDAMSITSAVNKVLSDFSLGEQLSEKGAAQLQKFTFQACIENTLKVYQSVVNR